MALVKTAILRAQTLLIAAYGAKSNYADYDYINKFIAIRNTDINNRFQSLGLNFDTQVVVLTAVPANTTDLSSYQADGGALASLVVPDSSDGSSPVEWRITGQSDLDWMPVPLVGKVVDTNTASSNQPVASDDQTVESYEWRGGIIYLSPCDEVVDLRIRGDFLPNLADNDAASFIRGILNVLVYWTCESISKYAPGGEAGPVYKGFFDDAKQAEADFVTTMAKAQMSNPLRLGGRRTQGFGLGFGGGFFPPVI